MNHQTSNPTHTAAEQEERAFLDDVRNRLLKTYHKLEQRVHRLARDIREQKTYMWEHKGDMDHVEKISARQSAEQTMFTGEVVQSEQNRIHKLIQCPYFGRFDFSRHGDDGPPLAVYVGIHSFVDEEDGNRIVYDWRAPISTLFYDFELGKASYNSPSGSIVGEILLKRQFRIQDGQMLFMIESGLNILDDVLQEELSRSSDDRMKHIVATIQRDQNAIIRNEDAPVLIIQGVAGSGKTSIALHRIAFLLYRFKETLTSKNVLIISPNKVFANFISNVLPELGEEQLAEKEMEGLAAEWLEGKFQFQTFFEQTSLLLETNDELLQQRIQEKSTIEFVRQLDAYVTHVEEECFQAEELWVNGRLVPDWLIEQTFSKRRGVPARDRLRWVVEVVEHQIWVQYRYEISTAERSEMRKAVHRMYRKKSLRVLYREFFSWNHRPKLFKPLKSGRLEYADVFPLLYLKLRLFGIETQYNSIRHLVIDEMQDYSAVQYAVISRMFPCEKTILGDSSQSINPFSASDAMAIQRVFPEAEVVRLLRSYRSSFEITRFAQTISPDRDLVAIHRHGEEPRIVPCENQNAEIQQIQKEILAFQTRGYRTMGIICKTQKAADKLHEAIGKNSEKVHLLQPGSTEFVKGVVVCTACLAKGLEFDAVHVENASAENYVTQMDQRMLYVACTRAMHRLSVTYTGTITDFLCNRDNAVNAEMSGF